MSKISFPQKTLTYSQVAELLNMPLSTLYSKVCRKEIPHLRMSGRSVLFDQDELLEWLNKKRVPVKDKNIDESGR